jgi:hypothetical protein
VDVVLHRKIDRLENIALALDTHLDHVGSQVDAVGAVQQQTRSELADLSGEFGLFRQHFERTANKQLAETRKGALENQLDIEFGWYTKVRRTAANLLRAFDSGLVAQETVDHATEMLMLENARYWLAPAGRALAAWSGGDADLCDTAIANACEYAPGRTALFFALVLRRQSRQRASVRWLRHYVSYLDPNALSREFAVVLESVAQGAFGPGGRALIGETVQGWHEHFDQNDAAREAQVSRWRFVIEQYRPAGAGDAFPRLRELSPQWPDLEDALRSAEAHRPFTDFYGPLAAAEHQPSASIEDQVDDLLDRLVDEWHPAEIPVQEELQLQREILKHEGDLDAARAAMDAAEGSWGATLDYLTLQTTAALDPDSLGVSEATQQMALATCADAIKQAHAKFCVGYRVKKPLEVETAFPARHPLGDTKYEVPSWQGNLTTTPLPELEKSLGDHWDAATGPFLASLEYPFQKKMTIAGVVSGLILLVCVFINPVFGVLVGGVTFGVWTLRTVRARKAMEALQKKYADLLKQARQQALTDLRGAAAELTDYQSRYARQDGQEQSVRELVTRFAELGGERGAFESRAVVVEGGVA